MVRLAHDEPSTPLKHREGTISTTFRKYLLLFACPQFPVDDLNAVRLEHIVERQEGQEEGSRREKLKAEKLKAERSCAQGIRKGAKRVGQPKRKAEP
jgi:hypothetical protein